MPLRLLALIGAAFAAGDAEMAFRDRYEGDASILEGESELGLGGAMRAVTIGLIVPYSAAGDTRALRQVILGPIQKAAGGAAHPVRRARLFKLPERILADEQEAPAPPGIVQGAATVSSARPENVSGTAITG